MELVSQVINCLHLTEVDRGITKLITGKTTRWFFHRLP
jgi:hypothetical protein